METRTCRTCKETLGMHMFHQKNRDSGISRHYYCKVCRNEERRVCRSKISEVERAKSAKLAEKWRFLTPPKPEDYIPGERLHDMLRRLGVDVSKVRFDLGDHQQ